MRLGDWFGANSFMKNGLNYPLDQAKNPYLDFAQLILRASTWRAGCLAMPAAFPQ